LIGHYDYGNASSYPGSGTVLSDLSSAGNHLTITNGGAYTSTGPKNMAYALNTSARSAELTNFNATTTGITLEAVVFIDSASGPFRGIFSFVGFGDNSPQISLSTWNPTTQLYIWTSNQNYPLTTVAQNSWVHITFTLGPGPGGAYNFYINGVAQTITATPPNGGTTTNFATNASITTTNNRIAIGDRLVNATGFVGRVAINRIYTAPLTQAQITTNYNTCKDNGNPYGLP
jgi:hypothetical protein